jgi:hypothetical protein
VKQLCIVVNQHLTQNQENEKESNHHVNHHNFAGWRGRGGGNPTARNAGNACRATIEPNRIDLAD